MTEAIALVLSEAQSHYQHTLAHRHSTAWKRITETLDKVAPGWCVPDRPGTIEDFAIEAILKLAKQSEVQK